MSTSRPIDLLRAVRPFSAVPDDVRTAVLERCGRVAVRAGAAVVTAGDVPAALSVVVSGQLRVVDVREAELARSIDTLGRGALAGETIFESEAAAFSVYALTDCELLQLSAADLAQLAAGEPQLDAAIRDHVAARTTGDPAVRQPTPPAWGSTAAAHEAGPAEARDEDGLEEAPPASDAPDDRSIRRTLASFAPYVRPLYPLLGELAAASVIVQVLALLLPLFARFVVDDVIARMDRSWLAPATAAMAGVVVLYLAASVSRRYLADFMSRQLEARLVADVYRHLLRLPMRFFEARPVGDVVGTFDDLERVTNFLTRSGVGFFIDLVTAAMYAALMMHYHSGLAAVAMVLVAAEVATLYVITPYLRRGVRSLAQHELESDTLLIESLAGLRTIKVLAMEPFVRWRMHSRLARIANASLATLKWRTTTRIATDLMTSLSTLVVLLAGAALVLGGRMTVGELVAFGILTHGLTAPFAELVTAWDTVQEATRSVRQVERVLRHPTETGPRPSSSQITLQKLHGHIRFTGVSFRYADDTAYVLRGVTFECYGGQRIAVLGRSGSGKSTLVKLLLGLHAPTSGEISVDGSPLDDIWLPSLRRQMGVVLQDTTLFRGSIRENVSHTMPAAPLGEVVAAATLVNAHRFITALPAGYDTELEENGSNLSGGQRQQIAIARALLHLPRVIVLDEATSNVDNESARLLQQNLDLAFRDATVITVTQGLDAARSADLILVLERGTIVEQGSHEELLAREGTYYQLTHAQAV